MKWLLPLYVCFLFPRARAQWQWNSSPDSLVRADSCADTLYTEFKQRVHQARLQFSKGYQHAANKRQWLDSCKNYLEHCISDSLFQFWQNTPWEFYGKSEVPRCGSIACGYFVTTLLRDMDFNIPRITWAEVASETFIIAFCGSRFKRYPGGSAYLIQKQYLKSKTNIFLAGLDNHVGILIRQDTSFYFMHSGFVYDGNRVVKEASAQSQFAWSNYRAVGELFHDEMIVAWLQGKKW